MKTITRTDVKNRIRYIRNEVSREYDVELKAVLAAKNAAEVAGDGKARQHWSHVLCKRINQLEQVGYFVRYGRAFGNMSVTVMGLEAWNGTEWVERWQ